MVMRILTMKCLSFLSQFSKKDHSRVINGSSSGDSKNDMGILNDNNGIMEIRNPVVRKQKGRPKSKRTKSNLEESNTRIQYKCKICKQIGHNSKTCKGKEN